MFYQRIPHGEIRDLNDLHWHLNPYPSNLLFNFNNLIGNWKCPSSLFPLWGALQVTSLRHFTKAFNQVCLPMLERYSAPSDILNLDIYDLQEGLICFI